MKNGKFLKMMLLLVLILSALLLLSGCLGTETETEEETCKKHSFDEGVVTKEPYCGAEGERTYTCSICGKTKTEAIPAVGEHSFPEEGEIVKAATCTETGIRRFVCSICGDSIEEVIPVEEGHAYDEGVVIKEPTCYEEGIRKITCTLCGYTAEVTMETLPTAFTVTMEGVGVFNVPESGAYKLPDVEKVGFTFIKWIDELGEDFPAEGVITASVTVKPIFEVLETKTVEELEERARDGAEIILIADDIVIDRTIYFTGKTTLVSKKSVRLIRDESFAGEMIVVGETADGEQSVLANGIAELTLGNADGSSEIIIDGNRDGMKVPVVGSAIFVVNSSRVIINDGITVSNHRKVGLERSLTWSEYVGSSCTMGGAAIFVVNGQIDIYGGIITNNSVNTENIGTDETNNYISSFGGAIYNCGTVNIYGGVISNNSAVRGGAIYTKKQLNILGGVIENNIAYNKGGAICTSESPYAEIFIGSEDLEPGAIVFRNNVAKVQGGVVLGYHYTPIIVLGGTLFEGNRAESSVGGVIATAGPVTFRNSEFKNNYAYESGGVIYQYYVGNGSETHWVTLDGCLFEGNEAGRGGVMLFSAADGLEEASSVVINACEFKDNHAVSRETESVDPETGETVVKLSYGSGGVIYATRKTQLSIRDTSFEGNSATLSAGAIFLTTDTVTTVDNSSFKANTSTLYGGAICVSEAKSLSVTASSFDGNGLLEDGEYSTERGGAIYCGDGSRVTTLGCLMKGNGASIGGAIYVTGKGSYLDKAFASENETVNSVFEANLSAKGGAISAYGTVELAGSSFKSNVSEENGGAVYGGSNAIIVAESCEFLKNTVKISTEVSSVKRFGGAVYGINANLTIKKSTFKENGFEIAEGAVDVKTYGGAVATSGTATLLISDSTLESNNANYGGAIAAYAMKQSTVGITGITFKGNSSENCGGAMYINDAKAILSGIVAENNGSASGGALYISQCENVTVDGKSVFKNNSADARGGAWFIGEGASVTDKSSRFEGNTSVNGGAMYINSTRKTDEQTGEEIFLRGSATLIGSEFLNNKASLDEVDSRGGAIVVTGGILKAENTVFSGNSATYYGGAIVGNTDSEIGLTDVSFTNNTAGNNGGAIWSYFGSEVSVKGIVAKGNLSGGNGGFIYTRGDLYVQSGSNIFGGLGEGEANTAVSGGVIFVLGPDGEGETSTVQLSGAKFIGNSASEGGGAIYTTKTNLTIDKSGFESNGAGKHGGAIQLLTGSATVSNSIFKANTAKDNGGAVYLTQIPENSAFITEKCTFESNSTEKNGGAVYVTGTGAYVDGSGATQGLGSTFKGNEALGGGAIFVYGSAELYETMLDGNSAENGGAIGISVTKLSEATETAEAVYSAGKVALDGAALKSNTATTDKDGSEANGGAIYLYAGASLIDNGSVYTENGATKGGAIYLAKTSGGNSCSLQLDGARFVGNTSTSHGGAICAYNEAALDVRNAEFNGNKATGVEANGGALYIYATDAEIINCKFDANEAAYRGGAVYLSETVTGSEVVTLGCEFKNNKATDNGGAIYLTGTAIYRDGGSLFSTNSAAEGGAIMSHGTLTLKESSFTGNVTSGYGSVTLGNGELTADSVLASANARGVYVKKGSFKVSGATVIHGNTESNVYLASGAYITVADALDTGAKIGITADSYNRVFVVADGERVTDASVYIDRFLSDSDIPVYKDENGNLLVGYIILEQPNSINNYTVKVSGTPIYTWYSYKNGEMGEAVEGQSASTLVGVEGESYVCVIIYSGGETLTTQPVTYAKRIYQPVCGAVCDCDETHEAVEFIPVTCESELALAATLGGRYYLYNDIEATKEILITSDVALSLNGRILRYVGDKKASVISVAAGAGLTLTDVDTVERRGNIDPNTGLWTEGEYGGEGNAIEIILKGGIISGGNATFGGAIHAIGALRIYGGNFVNNTAGHGGAIYIAEEAEAEIEAATFVGNTATVQGGAIRITYSSAVIKDSKFIGNVAAADEVNTNNCGGAMHIYYSSAMINGCEFIANSAGYRGGAIYATATPDGEEVVTLGCTFTDNSAISNGGAIYLTGTAIYRDGDKGADSGSVFKGNSSANGGAVMTHGQAVLNGSDLAENTATVGGAIYVGNGAFVDNGSTYTQNSADEGGAIYAVMNILIEGSTFEGNSAVSGGAIYVAVELKLNGSTLDGNIAATESPDLQGCGGAIYVAAGAKLEDTDSDYINNEAERGGAIYLQKGEADSFAVYTSSGSTFEKNSVTSYGGAICGYNFASIELYRITFVGNSSDNNGGAIWTYTDSTLTVKGIVAKGNAAAESGGLLYTRGNANFRGETENDSVIGGVNASDANTAKTGGAICIVGNSESNPSVFETDGILFMGNTSVGNGGAIYADHAILTLNDSVFSGNAADGNGGAIHATATKANVTESNFNKNSSGNHGGAIYVTKSPEGKTFVSKSSEFVENTAKVNGGAVYVTGTGAYADGDKSVENSGSAFTRNDALGGGAIFVYGIAELYGTGFEGNKAENGGAIGANITKLSEDETTGEIVYSAAKVTLVGASFRSNAASTLKENAEANGGAIYLYAGASLADEGSVYTENTATKGGAIYLAKAANGNVCYALLDGVKFVGNASTSHGGATCVYDGADVEIRNAEFTSNKVTGAEANGGALYVYGTGIIVESTSFDSNTAAYRGGAIYATATPVEEEVVTLGCTFTNNSSTDNGGAIYLTGTAIYRDGDADGRNASSFKGNSAANGGALMTHGTATLNGSVFEENTANKGGAVYVGNKSTHMNGGIIRDNSSGVYVAAGVFSVSGAPVIRDNTESGVYLASGRVITVAGELTDGAYISFTTASSDAEFASADGVNVTDISGFARYFFSDDGTPVYPDEQGKLVRGFTVFSEPTVFNGFIFEVSGAPTYAWYTYADGSIGEILVGQSSNTLTDATELQTYVCVATYSIPGGEKTLVSLPVTYMPRDSHPVCGGFCDCGEAHGDIQWIPITNADELRSAAGIGGSYYLATDIDLDASLEISADLQLCLNGKILRYVGEDKASVIQVAAEAKLTLTDCSTDERVGYLSPDTGLWTEGAYSGEGSALEITLKGGMVTGGNATFGGAIHAIGALRIYGGNFVNNTADHGGAIYIAEEVEAEIEAATFVGNTATVQGGAIRITYSSAVIKDSKFIGNVAAADEVNTNNCGGAMHIYYSSAMINGCEFIANSAGYRGGAIYMTQTPEEVVTFNCTFENNTSVNNGGAIYLTGTAIYRDGTEGAENGSEFRNNSTGISGGAVCTYGTASFYGSSFEKNSNTDTGNYSYMGGAIAVAGGSANIVDASFKENSATSSGGAIASYGSGVSLTVKRSYFESNNASNGGAIYAGGGSVSTVTDIIAKGNKASSLGAVVYITSAKTSLTLKGVTLYNNNTAKSISCGLSDLGNASAVLNIYKNEVALLDAESGEKLEIDDWSKLCYNSKGGIINELVAEQEG